MSALVRHSPVLYGLTVVGVALGVASVMIIQLVNANAVAAFAASVKAVTGEAQLSVVGRSGGLREEVFADVIAETEVKRAWPTVRIDARLGELDLDIVATDLTQLTRVPLGDAERFGDPLSTAGWVALSPALAARAGLRVGESFSVVSGTERVTLTLGGLVDFSKSAPLASSNLAVMDIAQGQTLFHAPGVVDEVGVVLADGASARAVAQRLKARLGPTVDVLTPDERADQVEGLLRAFRLNLTALSLISLAVGVFLIHSSLQATLIRRRKELGVLRALGATRRQVMGLVIGEVVIIGVLGTLVGLPVGYWVTRANIDVVSGTLTSLYLLQAIETVQVPTWVVGSGALIGVGSALLGASASLLELRREDTRSLLLATGVHEALAEVAPKLAWSALAVWCVLALSFVGALADWAPMGFVVAGVILVSVALVTPQVVLRVASAARPERFGATYALRALGQRLASNAFAVAALAIAVSMMFGITLMVGSFRATLVTWVKSSVQADIYVTTVAHGRRARNAVLDAHVLDALRRLPEAREIDTLRRADARVGERNVRFNGVDFGVGGVEGRYPLLHDANGVFEAVRAGGALITEPLARKAHLERGDTLMLTTNTGEHALPIAGVFYDYATEQGAVFVDAATFARLVGPGAPASAAIYLRDGVDAEVVVESLSRMLHDVPLVIRSNARLREMIYGIFDQTFAITSILQGMSLLIAVCGVALTLLVLARERAAELALYGALGATRRQVFGLFISHGVWLAGFGLVLGALGGGALALVLVYMINRAYFGWTIQLAFPWQSLSMQVVTVIAAAALAAIYPALRASRSDTNELVRDDL